MYIRDTIAAISTPIGEGGIGIVRISGGDSRTLLESFFRRTRSGGFTSHRFYYGTVVDPATAETIDEALVVYMAGPHSYTGEDVVEVQCHGGSLIVRRILDLVVSRGARLADPGEFTRRAFLNGRIDLLQAEAVIDVIRSKTDAALALAQRQREGRLSRTLSEIRDRLVSALALVESFIDFPEEDLGGASLHEIRANVEASRASMSRLLAGFDQGKVLRDGVSVVIAGKPNVGKSSLLNTLLREKRAIVTSIPGTTRDVIEEVINIQGLPVRLLDTAGIRSSEDHVEKIGIDLALEKIPEADLVLFLLDGSRPFDSDDRLIMERIGSIRNVLVRNKSDLPQLLQLPPEISGTEVVISTATGAGIDVLRAVIHDSFLRRDATDSREFLAISQARHRDALQKSVECLDRFLSDLAEGRNLEILAVELRESLHSLGEITGETTPDAILDLIFSRFCIGK